MRVFNSTGEALPSKSSEKLWLYNGLDCCVTLEVLQVIRPQLDETTQLTYNFERALQGPVLDMSTRGVLIDTHGREAKIQELSAKADFIRARFDRMIDEGMGLPPMKINSPQATAKLFYDIMHIPPVRTRDGGRTCNEAALEKIKGYYFAVPLVQHILAYRETVKRIGTLRSGIDADNRMRFSFGIASTVTGRFSSYKNPFGSGTNGQNLDPSIRNIFIADPGKKLAYIDLKSAESYIVGARCWNLFHLGNYLDACETGYLHVITSKMCWPDFTWTGDFEKDRELAEPEVRMSKYNQCKRFGHGSNYYGKAYGIAMAVGVQPKLVEDFQPLYFAAYPEIPLWHEDTKKRLLRDGWLVSLMGRRRWFMGRRWDDSTVREAIAYDPQSSVADILNKGLLTLWQAHVPSVDILLQVHDALVIQYDETREEKLLPRCMELLEIEVPLLHGRSIRIPAEAKTGWNWGYHSEKNPDGIKAYQGHDERKRQFDPKASFLDRVIR